VASITPDARGNDESIGDGSEMNFRTLFSKISMAGWRSLYAGDEPLDRIGKNSILGV